MLFRTAPFLRTAKLLRKRSIDENQEEIVYEYDDYGRLTKRLLPPYTNGMNETFHMVEHLEYTDLVAAGSEFEPSTTIC